METKVFEEIKKLIKSKFNKEVKIETVLNEIGIDSLDLLDLIVEAENKYNIKITDEELLNSKSIKDVVSAITTKLK